MLSDITQVWKGEGGKHPLINLKPQKRERGVRKKSSLEKEEEETSKRPKGHQFEWW